MIDITKKYKTRDGREAASHVELKPGFLSGSGAHYDMHPKQPGSFRRTLEDESPA